MGMPLRLQKLVAERLLYRIESQKIKTKEDRQVIRYYQSQITKMQERIDKEEMA